MQERSSEGSSVRGAHRSLVAGSSGSLLDAFGSELFARLVDSSSDLIGVSSLEGSPLFLNAAGRTMLGLEPPGVGDDPLDALRPEDVVHPLDRPRWFDEVLPAVLTEGEWRGGLRLRHQRSGEAVDVAWHVFSIRDASGARVAYANVATDVREQRRARAEVNRLASLVDAVTRAAPVGVAFVDEQLRFRYVNDKLAEINGVAAEDHLGRTIGEIVPKLADSVVPVVRRALETGVPAVGIEHLGETAATPGDPRVWLTSYYPVERIDGNDDGIGMIVTDITERRRLLEAEQAARATAESAMRRLEQLQVISDAALAALPLDELLEELMARLRAGLGVDTVRILLVSADGAHLADGGSIGLGLDLEQHVRIPVGAGFAGRVATARRPVVVDDLTTIEVVSPALRASGVTSIAGVPLLLGDELIGVIHVGSIAPRTFSEEEVDVLELAAERIALAIHRSRTYESERVARERADYVARVNAEATSHLDHRCLMEAIAAAAVPRLADWCSVYVQPDDGDGRPEVAIAHVDPAKVRWARQFSEQFEWDPEAPMGVAAVIRTGRPELYAEIDPALVEAAVAEDPRLAPLRELQLRSSLIVPLVARGRATGAMQLVRAAGGDPRGPVAYGPDDLALATDVAARVAMALDNARLYEASEKVALILLRSLLPDMLPQVPGIEVAVRYRPSAGDVGGDFYDLFPLSSGLPSAADPVEAGWGVVVGDVCGKGVVAASMTALTRHTLRAGALAGLGPADTLALASRALHLGDPGAFCTAMYGVLRVGPPTVSFTFAAGGHPLPIVVDPTGVASFVGAHGALLGLGDGPRRPERTVTLRPGEVLVLYTDGLTDLAPPAGLNDAGLLEVVGRSATARDPEVIADALLADLDRRLDGRSQADDVAVVVIAVDDHPAATDPGQRG